MKYLPLLALLLMSCSSHKIETAPLVLNQDLPTPTPLPRAQIYRMSGNATAANVPVQVNAEGKIVSFPAPSDLVGQEPIALKDGWLLDQRGIGPNTRFISYTYSEYAKLAAPPSIDQLQAAIIANARAVDFRQLPMSPSEAADNPKALLKYIP